MLCFKFGLNWSRGFGGFPIAFGEPMRVGFTFIFYFFFIEYFILIPIWEKKKFKMLISDCLWYLYKNSMLYTDLINKGFYNNTVVMKSVVRYLYKLGLNSIV